MKSRITHIFRLLLPAVLLCAAGLSRSASAQSVADSGEPWNGASG